MTKRLSDDRRSQLDALVAAGTRPRDVVAAGFTRSMIEHARRRLGIDRSRRSVAADVRAEIIRLVAEENLGPSAVARQFGVSRNTVYAIVKDKQKRLHRRFTPEDVAALRRLWELGSEEEIVAAVPGHSWASIRQYASFTLKLRRRRSRVRVARTIDPLFTYLRTVRESMGLRRTDLPALCLSSWERGVAAPSVIDFRRWLTALGLEMKIVEAPKQPALVVLEPIAVVNETRPAASSPWNHHRPTRPKTLKPSTVQTAAERAAIESFIAARGVTRLPRPDEPAYAEVQPLRWDAKKRVYTRRAPT